MFKDVANFQKFTAEKAIQIKISHWRKSRDMTTNNLGKGHYDTCLFSTLKLETSKIVQSFMSNAQNKIIFLEKKKRINFHFRMLTQKIQADCAKIQRILVSIDAKKR